MVYARCVALRLQHIGCRTGDYSLPLTTFASGVLFVRQDC